MKQYKVILERGYIGDAANWVGPQWFTLERCREIAWKGVAILIIGE